MHLQEFLNASELTTEQFASMIGVNWPGTITRWLYGTRHPTPDLAARVWRATRGLVTPNDLVLPAGWETEYPDTEDGVAKAREIGRKHRTKFHAEHGRAVGGPASPVGRKRLSKATGASAAPVKPKRKPAKTAIDELFGD